MSLLKIYHPGIVEEEDEGENYEVHLHVTPDEEVALVKQETDQSRRDSHEHHTYKLKHETDIINELSAYCCSDFLCESNGIFKLGVGFFLQTNLDFFN